MPSKTEDRKELNDAFFDLGKGEGLRVLLREHLE